MSNLTESKGSCHNRNIAPEGCPPYRTEQPPVGFIERLKEEFGDYSDLTTYDWSWHEAD